MTQIRLTTKMRSHTPLWSGGFLCRFLIGALVSAEDSSTWDYTFYQKRLEFESMDRNLRVMYEDEHLKIWNAAFQEDFHSRQFLVNWLIKSRNSFLETCFICVPGRKARAENVIEFLLLQKFKTGLNEICTKCVGFF